jgi:hypothetical protein
MTIRSRRDIITVSHLVRIGGIARCDASFAHD